MSRTLNIHVALPLTIALMGLLAVQTWRQRRDDAANERQFSERANLALRRTAHRLLAIAGDRTSAIPPVQQTESDTWLVRLEQNFDYDSLPPILRESFALHGIEGDYNVAVLDCGNDKLMLGYTFNAIAAKTEVPCGGREQTAGCYNLRVTFLDRAATLQREKRAWVLFAALGFSGLVFAAYWLFILLRKKRLPKEGLAPAASHKGQPPLQFGQSTLFPINQKLVTNGVTKDLTYRETKLLQLFCRNANQLLERDLILKSVWEDEGILVGRSVDVFVSRLRKLLKDDATVSFVNVHGVGYRMEVRGESVIERH